MAYVILGTILSLIWLYHEWGIDLSSIFISILLGILCGILGIIISTATVEYFNLIEKITYIESEREIYALKDISGIEGNFYLFGGNVGDEYQYRYVINTPKGKQVETVSSEQYDVYIKEGNYKPKVVCEKIEYRVLKHKGGYQ